MLLEIKHVTKVYEGSDRKVLEDINLKIDNGEFVCIVGPSGCGKSTLLNIIAGLENATSGEILLDGKKIIGPGAERGVMFQDAALFPWLTVSENVKAGIKFAKISKKEQEYRTKKYLKMVQLWEFKDYYIHELSGGMKQRTALARALALDSKILLMDEPFSALDKQITNILRDELENIWLETKKTILFITHSVEEAVCLADRVVILADNPGKIKDIYKIELPRIRHIESPEFLEKRKQILQIIREEVKVVKEGEYDKETHR